MSKGIRIFEGEAPDFVGSNLQTRIEIELNGKVRVLQRKDISEDWVIVDGSMFREMILAHAFMYSNDFYRKNFRGWDQT
jgi:hypothetical protein